MLRNLCGVLACLLLCVGGLPAEEVKGKIKKVDADKGSVTVTVGDKDQDFKVTEETKLLGPSGKDIKDGLQSKRLKEGVEVTVTCETRDGKDVCTSIRLKGQQLAGGVRAIIKKFDPDRATLTVTIGDKDQDLKITEETKLLVPSGKDLKDGLQSSRLTEGAEVTVVCAKKDGKDVCTAVQLKGQKKNK